MTVSPSSLSYGNQVIGTSSAAKKLTLKNGQSVPLAITNIASNLPAYSLSTTCPVSPSKLAAGASCTISITFTPTALGPASGTLTVTDSASNSPQTASLSGTGVAAVTATPSTVSFGNQVIGKKSTASKITVNNNQATALSINSITTSLADYSTTTTCPLTPNTLASASSCTVSVFFTPAAAGPRGATLTINDNASVSPTVTLSGTGIVPVVVNPTSLSFGSQATGTTSVAQSVTLTNNQSTALTITSIASSLSDFVVASGCPLSPQTLAAGARCTVSVTFSPKATGARSATLTFKDNANNTPQTVSLTGTGLPSLVSIALTPQPVSIALGKTQQFTATGTFTDGTTQNLTNSVTWTSSAPGVATIGTTGLATSVAQGATTISASSGTIIGSGTLTVTAPTLMSLAVSPATSSVPLGADQQFTATGTYTDGSNQNLSSSVNWDSSASTVANISAAGLATGSGIGSATITASSGSLSATAILNVGQPVLVSLAITPNQPSFALGTSQQLKATGTYTDGSTLDLTSTVTWNSTDSGVATVNAGGLAGSVAVGSTTVTANSGSITASTTLNITPATIVSIAVTPAIPAIPLGTTKQFTATATFTDGTTQNVTKTAQWSSDAASVASISNDATSPGLATSVGVGTANITATLSSISGGTTLTVSAAVLVSIAVAPLSPSIALGTTQQFTATGTFTDESTQDLTASANWASDTPGTATVNPTTGLAKSAAMGTANISATVGGITGSAALTVTAAALVSIQINPPTANIPSGTTQQFTAAGTYSDGTTQDITQSGHWSSTDATVATVSNSAGSQGLTTSLGTGSTTIGIASAGVSSSATLVVSPAALVSIAITPQAPTIALGTTQQFLASGTYTDGSSKDITATVTWNSSSVPVAIVSNDTSSAGLATSAAQGMTTITATLGSVSSATTLNVGQAAIVSIAVSPATAQVPLGIPQQFTATATFSDGSTQDITQSASWTSSLPAVAAMNGAGIADSASVGTTTISASSGSIAGAAVLSIIAPVATGLTVTPAIPTISPGAQQQFVATLTLSDGSSSAVTNTVGWMVTNSAVASVNSNGLVSGLSPGWTTVQASWNTSLSASATLVVVPSGDTPLSPNFFGMHINALTTPWPTTLGINFASWRTHDSGGLWWSQLNPTQGTYNWNLWDQWLAKAEQARQTVLFDLYLTPGWAASNPNASCSAGTGGGCSPPNDLNTDGTGADQHVIDFITALMTHVGPGKIQYIEIWNEPNVASEWTGTKAQLVRMTQDVRTTARAFDPNIQICSPAETGDGTNALQMNWLSGFLQAGGGQYVDVIALHGHVPGSTPEDIATRIDNTRTVIAQFGQSSKPIFDTESAWSVASPPVDQIAFLARHYLLQISKQIQAVYLYGFDYANDGDLYSKATGQLTANAPAYQQLQDWTIGATPLAPCSANGTIWTCDFVRPSGYLAEAVWDTSQNCDDCVTNQYPVSAPFVQYHDLSGVVTSISGVQVPIGPRPILLETKSAF